MTDRARGCDTLRRGSGTWQFWRCRALVIASLLVIGGCASVIAEPRPSSRAPDSIPASSGPTATPMFVDQAIVAGAQTLSAVAILGEGYESFRWEMDDAVDFLSAQGFSVHTFYATDRHVAWSEIVSAVQGARILLYIGHGVRQGTSPFPDGVGSFNLHPGIYVYSDQVRRDLQGVMAPDSIVILSHACWSTGWAYDDPYAMPQTEAERRVALYAAPFIDIGAQAYFASNYYGSVADTLTSIFAGYNMGQVFANNRGYSPSDRVVLDYPKEGVELWLMDDADGYPLVWPMAFVGNPAYEFLAVSPTPSPSPMPSATLTPTPTATPTCTPTPNFPILGNLPDEVHFSYSVADAMLYPQRYVLGPTNVGDGNPFDWEVSTQGAWFSVTPLDGTVADAFSIVPGDLQFSKPALYVDTVIVTARQSGVSGSPHQISVVLHVYSDTLYPVSVPLIAQAE